MKLKRLILLSGMGGDGRLMAPILVPGVEVVTPDHIEPILDEDMSRYAARVAESLKISSEDVIGGASFGGMVAAEIARRRPISGLILLGSCIHPSRLPWSYRWVEMIGRFVPDVFLGLRSWGPLVRWRFAPVTEEAQKCLLAMAANCPPRQLRIFGRMALSWEGAANFECPVLSIHGDMDRIIPLASAEGGMILKGAGHAFTLTHVRETIVAIEQFLGAKKFAESFVKQ